MVRTLLLATTLVLVLGAAAVPATARADERVDGFVRALRADPVVLSTALTRSVPPAQVAALRRAVAAAPVPIFVVVAPSFGEQPGLATLDALPDLLHDRLGRAGIYLAVDRSSFARAQAFRVRSRFDVDDLFSAVARDRPDATPGEAARYAVTLLTTGRRSPIPRQPRRYEETVQPVPVVAAGIGGAALGFVAAGWPWLAAVRRRRALARARTRAQPLAVAPPLDAVTLLEQARDELATLSSGLAAASKPPAAAFDAYAAASKLLDDDPVAIDLLAALELARSGRATLRGRSRRPCFFDPRHGPGTKRTRWLLGHQATSIPACRACAKAIAQGRAPVALEDRGRPYFEHDTLWARTGFGAVDDRLAQRVLAGEARR